MLSNEASTIGLSNLLKSKWEFCSQDKDDLERIKEKTFRFGSNIFKKQSLPYLTAAVLSFLTFDQEILTSSQRNNLNVGKVKQLGKEVPHRQAKCMF